MRVTTDGPPAEAPPRAEPVQRYRKIFPSYSHRDSAVVESFAVAARALGDQYLQDVLTLRAGERWDARLLELIEDADVFQLFWSSNSMGSPHCRDEWDHALALQRPLFIRPIYWEDPLPEDQGQGAAASRVAGAALREGVGRRGDRAADRRRARRRPAGSGQGTALALAQFAGQTVVGAAITDVWESARRRFARLLGRGDPEKTKLAERWLAETRQQLAVAAGAELQSARAAQAQRWEGRFADLLDEDPDLEAGLRALVEEIPAKLPTGGVRSGSRGGGRAGREVSASRAGSRWR